MRIVNGYPCDSGCDVRLAKQGIDPRNPLRDPVKQAQIDEQDALRKGEPAQASQDRRGFILPGVGGLLDRFA